MKKHLISINNKLYTFTCSGFSFILNSVIHLIAYGTLYVPRLVRKNFLLSTILQLFLPHLLGLVDQYVLIIKNNKSCIYVLSPSVCNFFVVSYCSSFILSIYFSLPLHQIYVTVVLSYCICHQSFQFCFSNYFLHSTVFNSVQCIRVMSPSW